MNTLVAPLREAIAAGRRLRVLYEIGPDLQMAPGAVWEDLRLEGELGVRHRDGWERIAVVTHLDWLWRAFGLFSWLVPGEIKLFHEAELEPAKGWLAPTGD